MLRKIRRKKPAFGVWQRSGFRTNQASTRQSSVYSQWLRIHILPGGVWTAFFRIKIRTTFLYWWTASLVLLQQVQSYLQRVPTSYQKPRTIYRWLSIGEWSTQDSHLSRPTNHLGIQSTGSAAIIWGSRLFSQNIAAVIKMDRSKVSGNNSYPSSQLAT